MKLLITSAFCTLLFVCSYGQGSNLIFFTEGGEKFTLYINGVKQNSVPLANVKAIGVNAQGIQLKVLFEAPGAPELTTPMMPEPGMEMTSIITKNKKGKYVFRPVGLVPLDGNQSVTETIAIRNAPATVTTSNSSPSTYTTVENANTSSVNVNVSEQENNLNLNVKVSDPVITQTMTTTSQTVVTQETDQRMRYQENNRDVILDGCTSPMTVADFEKAKKSIDNKSFSEDKMTICKMVIKANCLSVKQVVGFMELFTYEESKLQLAKLAYPKTVDKANYYRVNDAFTYSGSVSDLNKFLEDQE